MKTKSIVKINKDCTLCERKVFAVAKDVVYAPSLTWSVIGFFLNGRRVLLNPRFSEGVIVGVDHFDSLRLGEVVYTRVTRSVNGTTLWERRIPSQVGFSMWETLK